MKRILTCILAALLLLSLAACGRGSADTPVQTPPQTDDPTQQAQPLPEGAPDYFQLSISDEKGNSRSLSAYADGTGRITVDYQGDVRKVATMEPEVMAQLAAKLPESGLAALNGQNIYEDGSMASASMYISYPDGGYLGAGYSGTIPQAFLDAYSVMDSWFVKLLADVEEYVPRPAVMGQVDGEVLAEFEAILEASGIEPLDMFTISQATKDEYFAATLGLSSTEGILDGTTCNPMMSATAYSFVIVTLEEGADAEAVQKDFAANVDWRRWVCVLADQAMIAQKGNRLMCLVGSAELYQQTKTAAESNGWTVLETLKAN